MSPFIVVGNLSYAAGDILNSCFDFGYGEKVVGPSIMWAVFGLPFVLAITAVLSPFVIAYRAYVIIMIVVRNWLFCCCM